jgi:hypothetical protein
MKRFRWSLALVALTFLFLVVPRGGFPQENLAFNAPAEADIQQNLKVGEPFAYSFCLGRAVVIPAPGDSSTTLNPAQSPCGSGLNPSDHIRGGNGPYHFELDTMGGFPPIGLVLDANGVLRGTPKGTAASHFSVCAVDMNGARSCDVVNLQPQPAAAPNQKAKKGMNPARVLVVAGGLTAGALLAASAANMSVEEDASCGPAPTLVVVSAGGQPSSGSLAAYREWCGCMGYRTATTVNGVFGCAN